MVVVSIGSDRLHVLTLGSVSKMCLIRGQCYYTGSEFETFLFNNFFLSPIYTHVSSILNSHLLHFSAHGIHC